jgi:hypothetical protein
VVGLPFKELQKLISDSRHDIKFKLKVLTLIAQKRKSPNYPMYAGSQWFALPTEIISDILDFLSENDEYCQYHRYSNVPDEIFLPTILKYLQSKNNKIKIEKSLTFVDWNRKDQPLPVTFTEVDYELLINASKNFLYARKFDNTNSTSILDLIDSSRLI